MTTPSGGSRIEISPHMQGGAPVIAGTRITVEVIETLLDGTNDEIRRTYPQLTDDDVDLVRWFSGHYRLTVKRHTRALA